MASYEFALRVALLPDQVVNPVLLFAVEPSFDEPYLVVVERMSEEARNAPATYRVRLRRLRESLWHAMMKKMSEQQGRVVSLDESWQAAALQQINVATEERTAPLPRATALLLENVWVALTTRAEYPKERLVAPDGRRLGYAKLDGTRYRIWADNRSGTTHSPSDGSVLGDFVALGTALARYAGAPVARQPRLRSELDARTRKFDARLKQREACVKPYTPD